MMVTQQDVLELIEQKKDILTLCEGKRDVAALKKSGFTNVRELNRPLYEVVESIEKGSRVQILTDLDSEGRKLYATLSSDLKQRGVYVDNDLREMLFKTALQHIEGLDTYLTR